MYSAPATPQYAYAPPMPTFERGGRVKETYGLENAAEMIRRRGRGEDTVLAHITPQEAGILQLLGGAGTINPYTGLPEFGILKKIVPKPIYKLGSKIGKEIERGIESLAEKLGPVGQIAASYFGGPIGAALYAGLAPKGSSFDVKRAAIAGALTYGAGQLQGMGGAEAGTGAGAGAGADLATQQAIDAGIDIVSAPSIYPSVGDAVSIGGSMDASGIGTGVDAAAGGPSMGSYPTAPTASYSADVGEIPGITSTSGATPVDTRSAFQQSVDTVRNIPTKISEGIGSLVPESVKNVYSAAQEYLPSLSTVKDVAMIGSAGTAAYGAYQTKKELDAAKAEADRILADQANRKKEEIEWAQGVMRDYPYNYQRLTEAEVRSERGMAMGGRIDSYDDEIGGDDRMMQGGIAALAKGGLPPRYLRGGGDGMSDSIRANIEGKQEARLADGEFVVPADVVSHLGNGSSNAGAKRLYSMMDRVRKSRTGKTRQAPEVNTRRLMPA